MEGFSRREFFKKFIPKSQKDLNTIPVQETKEAEIASQVLSRREFLKFIGAIGATVAMGQVGIKTAEAQETSETTKTNDRERQEGIAQTDMQPKSENISHETQTSEEEQKDIDSYTETAIEQSLMMGAKYIANAVFEKLKIENGNKSMSDEEIIEYLEDESISTLFTSGVLAPIIEEALFRALPSGFINQNDKGHRWEIGIPTSFLFALMHNFKKEESDEWSFTKAVPISQFMGGLFYWYLMREKGYSHATMAHSMNNAIPFSIGILLLKAYPKEKATKMVRKIWGLKEQKKKF